MKGHAIIGFNHGLLGLAENPALGPGFFRQNTSGYALGVLTPKASPSGWVSSQAQQPITQHGFGTDPIRNPTIWLVESRNQVN